MPLVSIIVPIYKTEDNLRRCVDSLLCQTLRDIEIILVNDGSPDNSLNICREYESLDPRVRVIDKPNGGISSARNAGLDIAAGDYIGFVDSDDYVTPGMYEEMYALISKTDSDLCLCNFVARFSDVHIVNNTLPFKDGDVLEGVRLTEELTLNLISPAALRRSSPFFMGSVWRCVYRASSIGELRFDPRCGLVEDCRFNLLFLADAGRVCFVAGHHYIYCNEGNSTRRLLPESIIKRYGDHRDFIKTYVEERLPDHRARYDILVVCNANMTIAPILMSPYVNYSPLKSVSFIRGVLRDKENATVFKRLSNTGADAYFRLMLFMFKHRLSFLFYLFRTLLDITAYAKTQKRGNRKKTV